MTTIQEIINFATDYINMLYSTNVIDLTLRDYLFNELKTDDLRALLEMFKTLKYNQCCELIKLAINNKIAFQDNPPTFISNVIFNLKYMWLDPHTRYAILGVIIIAIISTTCK